MIMPTDRAGSIARLSIEDELGPKSFADCWARPAGGDERRSTEQRDKLAPSDPTAPINWRRGYHVRSTASQLTFLRVHTRLGETGMWFWVIISAVAVIAIVYELEQAGLAHFR
jgi:hypothetical protein